MIGLIIILLIDTSFIKIYDLMYKGFVSSQTKVVAFSVISSVCLSIEYLIIFYIRNSLRHYSLGRRGLDVERFFRISLVSLSILTGLFGILTFQLVYYNYYSSLITISIISLSYGTASILLIMFCTLFWSWYKSSRDLIVLLYFLSMALLLFNLITTALYTSFNLNDRPKEVRQYVGGSIDISVGRHTFLNALYSFSSIAAFVSLWGTTVALMKNYSKGLINTVGFWLLLSLPLLYFFVDYFYQFILISLLVQYLTIDPITVSLVLTAFLSLSKPVGGLAFGIVFWRISKTVSYGRNIQTCMIITGWGILLMFATDQALVQSLAPYPPFGLVTNTALILGSYLMLLGIYNSARLVAANVDLRKSVYKHAVESRLLSMIGKAEVDRELQNTVQNILKDKNILRIKAEEDSDLDLDTEELKKHLDFVIREVKKVKEDQ
jgi:hypothetical protein